jgi:hypothetical protein
MPIVVEVKRSAGDKRYLHIGPILQDASDGRI